MNLGTTDATPEKVIGCPSRRLQPVREVIARRPVEMQPVFCSAEQDVVGSLRPFNLAQITGLPLVEQPTEMPAEIGE